MQRQVTRGAAAGAGLIFHVFVMDSASTVGAGKASVAFSSFACRYIRNGEAISGAITPEDITTIGTYAAPTANTNIRIKAVDNTNMIGIYEVQIHADWVNATNSCQSLTIYLTATGVAVLPVQIPLIAANLQDGVRLGLTSLPSAAADAAGGLPISDAGGLDLDARLDAAVSTRASQTSVDDLPTNAELATALGTADDAVLTAIADLPTNAEFDARTLLAADYATAAALAAAGPIVADAVWDELIAGHAAAGSTGEALSNAGGAGTPPTVTEIADEVQTRTIAAVTVVNGLAANTITATSIATGALTAAKFAAGAFDAVWTVAARSLTSFGSLVADVATAVWGAAVRVLTAGTNLPTAAGIADAVWDETLAGHAGAGSAGLALSGASAPSAAAVADAVWDEAIAGHLAAGSTGDSLNNATAAGNPWAATIEGALTAEDILRTLAGIAAGKTDIVDQGGGAALVTFRTITDSGDIVVAQMQGSERQTVTVTP